MAIVKKTVTLEVVPAADFSLVARKKTRVVQGQTAEIIVSASALAGFDKNVAVSTSGLPTGAAPSTVITPESAKIYIDTTTLTPATYTFDIVAEDTYETGTAPPAQTVPGTVLATQVLVGPTGTSGRDGVTGPSGADGRPGYDGATGPRGTDGVDGATGPAGIGDTGPTGLGLDGDKGEPGDTGPTGWTGPSVTGPTGSASTVTGPTGGVGVTGSVGATGQMGATGPAGSSGSDPWTIVKLAGDFTTSNATNTNVTDFCFTPAINKTYYILGTFMLRTATATVGTRPGIAWPSNLTDGTARMEASTSLTAAVIRSWGAKTTQNAASTALATTADSHYGGLEALLVTSGTTSGDFQITLASETALTNVTIKAGSFFMYREI